MHDMLDPNDGHTARAYFFDQRDQRGTFVLSETAGNFVEQQNSRFR
jgi:hypothetical protein